MGDLLWDSLSEVLSLWEAGRPKAARAAWRELPTDFRSRVLRFVLVLLEEGYDDFPQVECSSWFGKVTFSHGFFDRLVSVVPKVNDA